MDIKYILFALLRYVHVRHRAIASSIIVGLIFMYLCSVQLNSFEIDCFYCV